MKCKDCKWYRKGKCEKNKTPKDCKIFERRGERFLVKASDLIIIRKEDVVAKDKK